MSVARETQGTGVEHHARIESLPRRRLNLWLPLLALALALYLGAETWFKRGTLLTLHAPEGYSLGVGDPLKYRGVVLGEVEGIELPPGLDSVTLRVRLDPQAESLCRVGSRFWIVHPEVGLDSLRGLETIVGARYIGVDPGDRDGMARYEFNALSDSPAQESIEPGGLNIRLLALRRAGLQRGAHVTYRGVEVGRVLETRLASDATGVEIEAYIRPPYVGLVRADSRFWRTGGLQLNLALLSGLQVELDSLRGLVVGGIAFATPDEAGSPFSDLVPFDLHDEALLEWERWRPSLRIGLETDAASRSVAPLLRASLRYEEDGWFGGARHREGWVLALPGALLGPRALLELPVDAEAGSAFLEVEGVGVSLATPPVWQGVGLIKRQATLETVEVLESSAVVLGSPLQDCLVSAPSGGEPHSVSGSRLTADERGWRVAPDIDVRDFASGALVFGPGDGRPLGIFLKQGDEAYIVPFRAEQW